MSSTTRVFFHDLDPFLRHLQGFLIAQGTGTPIEGLYAAGEVTSCPCPRVPARGAGFVDGNLGERLGKPWMCTLVIFSYLSFISFYI